MIRLVHGRHTFRDATYNERVAIKAGEKIKDHTFISFEGNEIIPATAASQQLGIAMKNMTGDEKKKCTVPYLQVKEGDELDIDVKDNATLNIGYYTLADAENIDAGSFSDTPISNAFNFFYNGRNFIVHSFGF